MKLCSLYHQGLYTWTRALRTLFVYTEITKKNVFEPAILPMLCCVQEVKVAASDTTSSGSLLLSLRVWQEERAAKIGRGASDTLEDLCSASYRYYMRSYFCTTTLNYCSTTRIMYTKSSISLHELKFNLVFCVHVGTYPEPPRCLLYLCSLLWWPHRGKSAGTVPVLENLHVLWVLSFT